MHHESTPIHNIVHIDFEQQNFLPIDLKAIPFSIFRKEKAPVEAEALHFWGSDGLSRIDECVSHIPTSSNIFFTKFTLSRGGIVNKITILNIDEYNPRKDRTKHSWFRIDNTIMFSKKLNGLSPDQKWFWICLLSMASFDQRDWVEEDFEYFTKYSGVTEIKIKQALNHFQKRQMIQIVPQVVTERLPGGNQAVPIGAATDRQTDRHYRQTDTYAQNEEAAPKVADSELEKVYEIYPRKEGKQRGMSIVRRDIRTPDDLDRVRSAISRYRDHIAKEGTEKRYVKHFSTFMSSWRDWLDPETGTVEKIQKKRDYSFLRETT